LPPSATHVGLVLILLNAGPTVTCARLAVQKSKSIAYDGQFMQ